MERAIGLVVKMDTVANVCSLSEIWFGSGDGFNELVAVNVREEVGVGIFVNGRLVRGENGMAGQFGHTKSNLMGRYASAENRGCWETLASNQAAISFYMEFASPAATPSFELLVKYSQSGDRAEV
jgi:predicted NBD/HSP70 family sugar kinase